MWDKVGYFKQFDQLPKDDMSYSKTWEYLDYSKEQAIELLGKYCDFNKHSYLTNVKYDNEVIFDGRLE